MKLKLDENLGNRGADVFRQSGHDVATVSEQGLTSAPDSAVLNACHAESRCLVTLDLDFSNPVVFPPRRYSGIAVLRMSSRATLEELLICCRTLVAALATDDITGHLWIVEPARLRSYQEPEDAAQSW